MARMHWDSLKYCKENKFMQLILNISFVLPLILVVLWIKPISREYLTNRVFSGMETPLWVDRERMIQGDWRIHSNRFAFQINTARLRHNSIASGSLGCFVTYYFDASLSASISEHCLWPRWRAEKRSRSNNKHWFTKKSKCAFLLEFQFQSIHSLNACRSLPFFTICASSHCNMSHRFWCACISRWCTKHWADTIGVICSKQY